MTDSPSAQPGALPRRVSTTPGAAKSGPQKALEKLGLQRAIDLALHLPLRYEDETRVAPIATLRDGVTAQVEGVVTECRVEQRPRRQLVVHLADDSGGDLVLRFIHFYPSQQKSLAIGQRVRARGDARGGFFGLEMVHPAFKVVTPDNAALPSTLTPVYPTSAQLPQAYLRKAVAAALGRADLSECLPVEVLPPGSTGLRAALVSLHQPAADADMAAIEARTHPAWQRLKFDELLAQQLSQLQAKREREGQRAPRFEARSGGLRDALLAALPFALTEAQRKVGAEIAADLRRDVPMHRLLQGDVGSGKTVVAALAALSAIEAGWQCALMAPTEILAEQHLKKLVGWLAPLGITVAWLTGRRKGKARAQMLEQVASGEAMLVVGTHAVIEEQVRFARLGLAIIDEQHRFGVQQRLALRAKLVRRMPLHAAAAATATTDATEATAATAATAKTEATATGAARAAAIPTAARTASPTTHTFEPHTLMMTATPIPRTLAMTVFADLDISTIDALPPGRTPVVTKLFADARRDEVVARIRDAIADGQQAYWVCPLIDEDEDEDGDGSTDRKGLDETSRRNGDGNGDGNGISDRNGNSEINSDRNRERDSDLDRMRDGPAFGRGSTALLDLQNVTRTHRELSAALPGRRVGLLHGRMRAAAKAAAMALFAAGEVDVLVSTTVIEVGVDVANASLMVIEHAERFGLAQLHQLRGRVGRGSAASVCVLLYSAPLSVVAKARLKAMMETGDGFEISRRDLEIRGPGEFMGARQSGEALLRFADLLLDEALLVRARQAALTLLETDPAAAAKHVERWLGGRAAFMNA